MSLTEQRIDRLVELVRTVADEAEEQSPFWQQLARDRDEQGRFIAIPTLFDQLPAQPTETSRAAAKSMAKRAASLRTQVFEFIRDHGPCTDEEIANALRLNPSTARPRRIELVKADIVIPVGLAATASGHKATTWGLRPIE